MKKRLALILSAVMAFSVILAAFGATSVSAAKAKNDYIDAVMSYVSVDCVPDATEYVLDTATENFYIGAAWNDFEGMLYLFTIDAVGSNFTVEIGGKTLKVSGSGSISGIKGATGMSTAGYTELAIPIDQLSLGYNGTYATVNMKISSSSSGTEFDGKVIFTDYSNTYEFNEMVKTTKLAHGAQINGLVVDASETLMSAFVNNDYTLNMIDKNVDESKARTYLSFSQTVLSGKSNQYFEFDIKVNALPNESFFRDDQSAWNKTEHTRIWLVMKYASNAQIYMNIINSAEGLVLLVQRTGQDPEVVALGREIGDKFTLSLIHGSKGDFLVRVDGKNVAETSGVIMSGSTIGSSSGVMVINTGRNNSLPAGGVDIEISNLSAGLRNTEYDTVNGIYYDLDALLALSTTAVDKTVTDENVTEGTDGKFTISGATILSGGSAVGGDGNVDGANAEEEGGCGSSVAGMGIVMILGSALTAVVATRKKED